MAHALVANVDLEGRDFAEAEKVLNAEVIPAVKQAPGFQSGVWLRSPDGKVGMGIVVFDTEANAKAAEQAVRMAETVEGILASLSRTEDRVLLDGTVTDAPPSDPSLPVDWDWYGAERPWLESFVAFCRRSEGFTPL